MLRRSSNRGQVRYRQGVEGLAGLAGQRHRPRSTARPCALQADRE